MKITNILLAVLLVIFTVILKPHRNILKGIKLAYRSLAVAIMGFFSYKIFPLVPGAASEVAQGLVPLPMLIVTLSYLLLIYAGCLMFWRVSDQCTIQLKNRFNIEP